MPIIHRFFNDENNNLCPILKYISYPKYFFALLAAEYEDLTGKDGSVIRNFEKNLSPYDIVKIGPKIYYDNYIFIDGQIIPLKGDRGQFLPYQILDYMKQNKIKNLDELLKQYKVKTYNFTDDNDSYFEPEGIFFPMKDLKANVKIPSGYDIVLMPKPDNMIKEGQKYFKEIDNFVVTDKYNKDKKYNFAKAKVSLIIADPESESKGIMDIDNDFYN